MRRPNTALATLASALVYRGYVIVAHTLFYGYLTGRWKWALGTTGIWAVINTAMYVTYHYPVFSWMRGKK